MNLLSQSISPRATESGAESSAKTTSDPSSQSVKGPLPIAAETKAETSRKDQELPPTEGAQPFATTSASPEMSAETAPSFKIPPLLLEGDAPAPVAAAESDPKFASGLSPKEPEVGPEGCLLPETYGTGRLWLAARDPHCLYARWDFTTEQQRQYAALAIGNQLVLRVHLEAVQDRALIEVKLPVEWRHCFVPIAFAGRRYLAELGYYGKDQRWHSIAVSEVVSTPQQAVSQDKTVRFAIVPRRSDVARQTIAPSVASGMPEGPQKGQTQEQPRPSTPQSLPEVFPFSSTLRIPSTLPASPEAGIPTRDMIEGLIEAEFTPAANWSPAQEQALANILAWSSAGLGAPSSAEMGQVPAALGPPVGISSFPQQGEISSRAGGPVPEQTDFRFSLNAELVIYGATEPTARVTVAGRAIQLRPDGSFSCRFALPDGRYELPIEAASAQGDSRRADLEFYRRTTYQGDVQAHPQDPELKKPDAGNVQSG